MANCTPFKNIFVFLLTLLLLSSCTSWLPDAHRQDVTQGNEIKQKERNKILVGMQKAEITAIIGNPTLKDPFHANRWDYIYRYVPGRGEAVQSRLTLFFKDDELIKIDDSDYRAPVPVVEKEE